MAAPNQECRHRREWTLDRRRKDGLASVGSASRARQWCTEILPHRCSTDDERRDITFASSPIYLSATSPAQPEEWNMQDRECDIGPLTC